MQDEHLILYFYSSHLLMVLCYVAVLIAMLVVLLPETFCGCWNLPIINTHDFRYAVYSFVDINNLLASHLF